MTTTTKTLGIDAVVSERIADKYQSGNAMGKGIPAQVQWSEVAPSEYAILARWSALEAAGEGYMVLMARKLTKSALLAALLAMADARVAQFSVRTDTTFFGLFSSVTSWISRGHSSEDWPAGSIESSLQERLTETPVKVRDLVANWIGKEELADPWGQMRDRIVNRLVTQGTIERCQEPRSFLFFKWTVTKHGMPESTKSTADGYPDKTGIKDPTTPTVDQRRLGFGEGGAISGGIDKGFSDRTESNSG